MVFEKDYGDGFVRLTKGLHLLTRWNSVDCFSEAVTETLKTQRCVQDFNGNILLNEKDSSAVLSKMTPDVFWFALDAITCVPKIVETRASGRLIVVLRGNEFTVGQIEELMGAVKQYLLANPG